MDNVEMAIQKVCASKVYTSAEFKREKDNFQSLCKNLERAETKKWLNETLETLMKVGFEFPNYGLVSMNLIHAFRKEQQMSRKRSTKS